MPRKGRRKGDRKREAFERKRRDAEYAAWEAELHRWWHLRRPTDVEVADQSDPQQPEPNE